MRLLALADGTTVQPDEVLGPEQPGAKLVFVGDAAHTQNLYHASRGADALVIEATYLERESELARQFGHLTARRAAELAGGAGVKTLILTHLSRRYFEREVLAEAQPIFANTFVARDLDRFQIVKGGATSLVRSES